MQRENVEGKIEPNERKLGGERERERLMIAFTNHKHSVETGDKNRAGGLRRKSRECWEDI